MLVLWLSTLDEVRQTATVDQVAKILSTLIPNGTSQCSLETLTLRITPRLRELRSDGTWPLNPLPMRRLEDVILHLIDSDVISKVAVEVNLGLWRSYGGHQLGPKLLPKSKKELDAEHAAQIVRCFETLRKVFPRLEERGVLDLRSLCALRGVGFETSVRAFAKLSGSPGTDTNSELIIHGAQVWWKVGV